MKNLIFAALLTIAGITVAKAQGDPSVTSAGFQVGTISVGQTTVLRITLANSDFVNFGTIPTGGYQVEISLPASLVYRAEPLGVSSMTQVSGPAFGNFTYDGTNLFIAELRAPQGVGDNAVLQIVIKGYQFTGIPVFSTVIVSPLIGSVNTTNIGNNDQLDPSLIVTGVLPLRLQNFAGTSKQCTNTLTWKSTEEKNLQSIEVESSEDGASFKMVGSVVPKNIVGIHDYSYVDEANTAKVFYRLKIIDLDGRVVYSDVIRLNTLCKQPSASMFPNPMNATTDGTVVLKNFAGKITAHLQDMGGKQLATIRMLNGSNIINLSKYAQGTYLLKVVDENLQTQTLKIVTYK